MSDDLFRELNRDLLNATNLVKECLDNKITLECFINSYNNYYYYEAFGWEEECGYPDRYLNLVRDSINFHKKIQEEIVDRIYFCEDSAGLYQKAGRINQIQAIEKLRKIAKESDIDSILEFLLKLQQPE